MHVVRNCTIRLSSDSLMPGRATAGMSYLGRPAFMYRGIPHILDARTRTLNEHVQSVSLLLYQRGRCRLVHRHVTATELFCTSVVLLVTYAPFQFCQLHAYLNILSVVRAVCDRLNDLSGRAYEPRTQHPPSAIDSRAAFKVSNVPQ